MFTKCPSLDLDLERNLDLDLGSSQSDISDRDQLFPGVHVSATVCCPFPFAVPFSSVIDKLIVVYPTVRPSLGMSEQTPGEGVNILTLVHSSVTR